MFLVGSNRPGENVIVGPAGTPIDALSESITVDVVLAGVPAGGFGPGTTSVDATVTIAFDEPRPAR
ncbi:hypothetical protein [Cellulomonas sp. S1-8]|uniref:hypothetical protein n=1 Tax=Cellulomonas sp. S1-8 TaxID=2904790 RepID=UPI00224465B0|nr:hypothetical protein [Cellulomonas sp. S1-8]UZN03926.1 hypothetical protein OKX07_03005 [Cellulomonas sp. S1-8]